SNHGNWATWNDEVWQMVGSDQNDILEGTKTAQNIHQAGPYMNNYTHRASDLTDEPFYSPQVNSYYDASNQSYTSVYWGQSENPDYVYDPTNTQDPFRPSTLYYQRYKNLGDGVIQVDFLIFNYHRTRGIDYWNVPWAGIRNSSLPYAFVSNSATNEMTYEALNNVPGYVENSSDDLPEWSEGVTRKTSGNNSLSSGWFAFSNTLGGNGPSLAFVTAKSSSNPNNGYGDLRWGTAMGPNGIRDLTIFSRRSIGGPEDSVTGLKSWGIIGGESIRGRYFIVIDTSIDAIAAQIQSRNLVAASSIEKFTFTEANSQDLFFTFTNNGSGNYTANETTQENSDLTIKSKPFVSSFPVYILTTASATRITANPYYFSLRPYDGTVTSMELLGFSATALDINPATLSAENPKTQTPLKLYPNPVKKKIFLSAHVESAKIYSVSGGLIQEINTAQSIFDVSNLNSGLYFIEVSVKNTKQTLKFVVQ
ncbi:T9SS type A sorting domain-containing protein, partial [bacterium]|nr:T9SS type A sorting domain-containing protein [bacterium]